MEALFEGRGVRHGKILTLEVYHVLYHLTHSVLQREDEPIDVDKLLRESEAMDDPTIRKNEYYHRTVRDPEHQRVECHIPGKPFLI